MIRPAFFFECRGLPCAFLLCPWCGCESLANSVNAQACHTSKCSHAINGTEQLVLVYGETDLGSAYGVYGRTGQDCGSLTGLKLAHPLIPANIRQIVQVHLAQFAL